MCSVDPSGVLGCRGSELLVVSVGNTELVLWRRVLRWVVVGVIWRWVGVIAGLQRGWVTEVCCQVWLSRWVVNVGCYM